jgi:hypothetical protein
MTTKPDFLAALEAELQSRGRPRKPLPGESRETKKPRRRRKEK